MNDLRDALEAHAAAMVPSADIDDVLRRVRHRRRRARAVGVAGCVALVTAAIVGVLAIRRTDTSSPASPYQPAIGGLTIETGPPGSSLDDVDPTAKDGPWSIVVRAVGGSLGLDSAVVTYPVAAPTALATSVDVGGAHGFGGERVVVWPIGDRWARVRGDLDRADLVRIATAVSVRSGLPHVGVIDGFSNEALQTYRSPEQHQVRYGSAAVGQLDALGDGLTYTNVLTGGWFEDALFETHGRTGYTVQGHPAAVSTVDGGNGTLAWSPAPGVVELVGYSGVSMNAVAIDALLDLAEHTSTITPTAWNELRPQIIGRPGAPVDSIDG